MFNQATCGNFQQNITLGQRVIPVLVYEKNFENIFTDELGQQQVATVTQFFINKQKGLRYESPFTVDGAPLKFIITIWDGAKENQS